MELLSFPNPVNEKAARVVAAGVASLSLLALLPHLTWLSLPIAVGFALRVAAGPRFSPLGLLATRLVAPRLGAPKLVPGPPKRFAQAIGASLSTAAALAHLGLGATGLARALLAVIVLAALLESVLALCLGCVLFGQLMRAGVISADVCRACSDVGLRYGQNGKVTSASPVPGADLGSDLGSAAGSRRPAAGSDAPAKARRTDRLGLEVLLVLGVSLGISALYSWVNFLDIQTRGGFRGATATLNPAESPRAWVDLSYQVLGLLNGVVPALLALLLLSRLPGLAGFGIGLDRSRWRREGLQGLGIAALIGLPGLGLVVLARHLGVNAELQASGLAEIWYRYPVLIGEGVKNGVVEEVVIVGYLLTRLRAMRWPAWRAILVSALIRASYHTYQGIGGFAGNLIMGVLFGWWFARTKRVLPLVIAHSVIDIVSFVGYAALHDRLSWL